MVKRNAEESEDAKLPLKGGERPTPVGNGGETGTNDFEDEFEDEFESEDEIFEAGVDGRPDEEREKSESVQRGMWTSSTGIESSFVRIFCLNAAASKAFHADHLI